MNTTHRTTAGRCLMLTCGWLMLAGAAFAQPAYNPVGPQVSVPVATVTAGGWTECYRSNYNGNGGSVASVLASCDKANLMMACGPVAGATLDVLAQAPRADVTFDTAYGNVTHAANGSEWYFSDDYSWGFAPLGEPVQRNSCDVQSMPNNNRICLHTSGGDIQDGWRCGSNNGNQVPMGPFERIFFHADATPPGVTLTIAGSNTPVPVAEELILPPERTLANPAGRLNIITQVGYAFSSGEVRYARVHCPGAEFTTASVVDFTGDVSNTIGAVNGLGTDAIYFSITAGATPVVATDGFTIDGTRSVSSDADVNCTYGLYDFPSQAQAGGATGRVATTSGAYLRFNPSYALVVNSQGGAVANVESEGAAYSEFVFGAPTYDVEFAQLGGFSYGTSQQVVPGMMQPITIDGLPVELTDLMGANTALVFAGDFGAAGDVFLSQFDDCSNNLQSADDFDATEATFVIGSASHMNRFLCFEVSGDPIPVSEYTVALAPVSAAPAVYAVTTRGPEALGEITRNGAVLQAPLAQVPAGYLSRMVLTNTGSLDRGYVIEVLGETGNTISTANLTGSVAAGKTLVVDLTTVLTGFTASPRATLNVTVSGPNAQIQGLYQIVNPDSGTVSNHVMVRPGTN